MHSFSSGEISPDQYKLWFTEHYAVLRGRTPFHQPLWLSAVAKASGYQIVFIGIFDRKGKLTAAMPGFLKRLGPVKVYGSPLRGTMTPFLGPVAIFGDGSREGLIPLVMTCSAFARKRWGVAYTEFGLHEFCAPLETEVGQNWESGKWSSYFLDLTRGQDALWTRMQTRFRTSIRKSQQLGLRIVPLKDPQLYCEMNKETLGRRGATSWHTGSFFQKLLENVPEEQLWALAVEYEKNIIAAGIFVHDETQIIYLSGTSRTQYRSLPTSYLLHWHVIETAVKAGLKIYDLGGRTTANVDLFKKSLSPLVAQHSFLSESSDRVRYVRDFFLSSLPRLRKITRWLTPN